MAAQAIIFDLTAFDTNAAARLETGRLLDEAVGNGCHCALVTDLPHREAGLRLRERFGDTAHHIFSVVLTGADYAAHGHKAPYAVVLRTLDLAPEQALVVAASTPALQAAQRARLQVRPQAPTGAH